MDNTKKFAFKPVLGFEPRQLLICQHIIAMQQNTLAIVKSALPADIACHVLHCVPSGNRLLLFTESAGWASQIRFFTEDILNKIATSGQEKMITRLQIKIMPHLESAPAHRPPRLPSAENIRLLAQGNQQEAQDPLQQSLQKLAKTLNKRLNTHN